MIIFIISCPCNQDIKLDFFVKITWSMIQNTIYVYVPYFVFDKTIVVENFQTENNSYLLCILEIPIILTV